MARRKKDERPDAAPWHRAGFEEAPQAPFVADESDRPGFGVANRLRLTLGPGGRVVIPAALREAMQVEEGDALLAWLDDGELHLLSPRVGARQAQAMMRDLLGSGLADDLIADRRREAEAEARG
ncbi:AbrB/MazE/SpoVT family DNA-binding domain-containing protein [Rhodomicrobium sp. Az07]|uniref:AbrB/MazE/SpoVT family DNA-binding domain-containing protein n=1 Tax=Rhodomicrobium sp. Az07 TaxID=2839034 RepID=UPI001BE87DE2|nr:AbrB/MazE/SpoVT family DNA-binding domain-containing protein [Rhodomicrobium sp. Az07]MBT3069889.1 AbrB/MazE/SpoVT family DNA-binding domain-containing protein [Rhodomicrobium sp. Az07]